MKGMGQENIDVHIGKVQVFQGLAADIHQHQKDMLTNPGCKSDNIRWYTDL